MPVTVTATDAGLQQELVAVAPSSVESGSVFAIDNNLPNGDVFARTEIGTVEGMGGSWSIVALAVGPTTTIRLGYEDLDSSGAVLSSGNGSNATIGYTDSVEVSLPLPPAVAGTVQRRLLAMNRDNPPGDAVRTNIYPDPRCTSASSWSNAMGNWSGMSTWTWTTPISGLSTAVRATCTTAETQANRRLSLYQSLFNSPAVANAGLPIVAGKTYTASMYVYLSKATAARLDARCFAGTTWSHALVSGPSVAVPASIWTRLSVTFTAPAGANRLALSPVQTDSVAWAVSNTFGCTAVMVEEAGSAGVYFDGETPNGIPSGITAWETDTNDSPSLLWTNWQANRKVQLTDPEVTATATADEIIGAALERDLRRSVADLWTVNTVRVAAGVPATLAGTITYLCASLRAALAVDAVYQSPGVVVLASSDELNGLRHWAVGRTRISPERAMAGRPARWLVQVELREQEPD